MHSALGVKALDCLMHLAPRKLLNHSFQFRVFLAHDFVQPHRHHASVLKLRERPPGLYRLMLPTVTDEQDTVIGLEPVKEFSNCRVDASEDSSRT